MRYNGVGGYDFFTFLEEAWDDDAGKMSFGWADGDEYLITTDIITADESVWVLSPTNIDITFKNPLK